MALLLSTSAAEAIEMGKNSTPITLGALTSESTSEDLGNGLKTIKVNLEIKIPDRRFSVKRSVEIPAGFNVNETVSSLYKVVNGVVCCRQADIRCIGDVCYNPSKNYFWTISINGNYQNTSAKSLLSDQDELVLTYSGPVQHQSLEAFLHDAYTKK